MKHLSTIIYYTSNREDEKFEKKIQQKILENSGGLPIISVSQKSIDFGENLCIGDVGVSNQNCFRQQQIGAEHAKTPYIIMAEADFLYPPEYFQFVPPKEKPYRLDNIWIMYRDSVAGFVQKSYSEGASIYPREFFIKQIERRLKGRGYWNTEMEKYKAVPRMFYKPWHEVEFFHLENPAVSIKTKEGMHKYTGVIKDQDPEGARSLPYWGDVKKLRKELFT